MRLPLLTIIALTAVSSPAGGTSEAVHPTANGTSESTLSCPAETHFVATQGTRRSVEMRPRRSYTKPGEPIDVQLIAVGAAAPVTLVLLDESGALLGSTPTLRSGVHDIASLIPATTGLTRAAYLQLLEGETPVGSALVVQPLRTRPPVRTMTALRPDGTSKYTKVIGWGSTLLHPDQEDEAKQAADWLPGDQEVTSGFRLQGETDAVIETERGSMRVAFSHPQAPNTVANFLSLAREGLYDGTIFHRIVPVGRDGHPFVIQGGDPTGTGDGGPGWDLPLEPSSLPHDFGVISMARADAPDSAGSQFFLCLSREGTARLDGQYCAFGYLLEGADTMQTIAQSQIADAATGRPSIATTVRKIIAVPAASHAVGQDRRARRVTAPAPGEAPPAAQR